VNSLCSRFGEKTHIDVKKEFNKLKQKGTLEEYQVRFKELRSLLSLSHPFLDGAYFVSSFISGLDELIRPTVKMLYPTIVGQAVEQARLHELSLETLAKRHRLSFKGSREETSYSGMPKGSSQPWLKSGSMGRNPLIPTPNKALTLDQKRQMGLYFRCGERFGQGYQCKRM